MKPTQRSWSVIVPMANEENEFKEFTSILSNVFDQIDSGRAYLIVDNVSKDRTLQLCRDLAAIDNRFVAIYAPENRSVVDAYLKGYRVAFDDGYEFIIEMDAGLSHDPRALPFFLEALENGNLCVFGSRFVSGGSMGDSPWNRRLLSRTGTMLSNLLLGSKLNDMTSGYQGFHRIVVEKILQYPLKSKAHFYQTELRYLLRNFAQVEIPIHYRAPSPRVSQKAIKNAIDTLLYYFRKRISGKSIAIH